jgi:methylaspartate mutase epsilon subunit
MTSFSLFIHKYSNLGQLIVQPRMGFGTISQMQLGLSAVKNAMAPTIGTITLDSYTRVNQYQRAKTALEAGDVLNGYPIVTHGTTATSNMLHSIINDDDFTVQVRHGTALPSAIFKVIAASGIDATEGGPISYCLPYSRIALKDAVLDWRKSCELFVGAQNLHNVHIESFAGCMLGQLCPPSLLIAIGVLECLFFKKHGIKSVSLSYAQGTSSDQDIAAIAVLRKLANAYLSDIDWHVVMYTYMGMFPTTILGSYKLIAESASVASITKCERLIVKTPVEAHRIPTIEENIASLEMASIASQHAIDSIVKFDQEEFEIIYTEANGLIEHVLNLDQNLDLAIIKAFHTGILDVPYCLHKENKNKTRCYINDKNYLKWANHGLLPIKNYNNLGTKEIQVSSSSLFKMLGHIRTKYDT